MQKWPCPGADVAGASPAHARVTGGWAVGVGVVRVCARVLGVSGAGREGAGERGACACVRVGERFTQTAVGSHHLLRRDVDDHAVGFLDLRVVKPRGPTKRRTRCAPYRPSAALLPDGSLRTARCTAAGCR